MPPPTFRVSSSPGCTCSGPLPPAGVAATRDAQQTTRSSSRRTPDATAATADLRRRPVVMRRSRRCLLPAAAAVARPMLAACARRCRSVPPAAPCCLGVENELGGGALHCRGRAMITPQVEAEGRAGGGRAVLLVAGASDLPSRPSLQEVLPAAGTSQPSRRSCSVSQR